ncbi:hypothetical protein [Bradyrhizobium sp. ORS 86]|uniref:hypothetical protein n=1 Tax=Bradyrhizobium sp. ORS 86 TaxID=1685970 RepID=UPI00388F60FE
MSVHLAKEEHQVAYQDLCALVAKHAGKLSPAELLAVAANMLGKLVAMQDQRVMTPEKAMAIVAKNLEVGNRQVIEQLMGKSEGRA